MVIGYLSPDMLRILSSHVARTLNRHEHRQYLLLSHNAPDRPERRALSTQHPVKDVHQIMLRAGRLLRAEN